MSKAEEIAASLAREYGIERAAVEHIKDELEAHALACLAKADERMKQRAPKWYQLGDTEESRYYSTLSSTITSKENLV